MNKIEKFLFSTVEKWVLMLIVFSMFLFAVFFGVLVRQELIGTQKLGTISKAALFFAEIPVYIKQLGQDEIVLANRFPEITGFIGQPLKKRQYLLLSRTHPILEEGVVELVDLTNFSVIHTWNPDITYINSLVDKSNPHFEKLEIDHSERRYRAYYPILMNDGSLIFQNNSPLVKIDFCSQLIWQNQDSKFHHSNELDQEGYIYSASRKYPYGDKEIYVGTEYGNFYDDAIAKVNQDGELVYEKSIADIFIKNNLKSLLFGLGDRRFDFDPIHLNDIQPVLKDGDFWKKGDLFLSLRHQSMVILFRPSTDEIIWTSERGVFSHQHDVNIINGHTISVFNNNNFNTVHGEIVDKNNQIIFYDFKNNNYSRIINDGLMQHEVRTITEGKAQVTDDGDIFIEESNYGRSLYFDKNGELLWQHVNRAEDTEVFRVAWSRLIYKEEDIKMIDKLTKKECVDE